MTMILSAGLITGMDQAPVQVPEGTVLGPTDGKYYRMGQAPVKGTRGATGMAFR